MFALVDCNSCYASCEQIFRPDLRGRPVVILSNNDGCIVARNKEAKSLNIPDMQPYFQLKALLEQNSVQVFSSNYELYGDISRRIMNRLADFTDELEVYSIDEAFLSMKGMRNLREKGLEIKAACWKEQRMPVCVGIAKTKTLAKLANHIAKKSAKLKGVCVIENLSQWEKVFSRLPVKKVWGVGGRIALRLELMGIRSVQDLRQSNISMLRKKFGIVLERTVRELNGESCAQLAVQPQNKKQIVSSRSFGRKVSTVNELMEAVASYTEKAAFKLRRQKSQCQQISVTIETSRFIDEQARATRLMVLPYPTNDSRLLIESATTLCRQMFVLGKLYAKAGVCLMDITDTSNEQHDFFTESQPAKTTELMATLDNINSRFGQGQVFIARQGILQSWKMQRAFKSPCYTTRLSEIPIIILK